MNGNGIAETLRGGEVNVGGTERLLSAVGGGVLLGAGVRRGSSLPGVLLGLAAAALLHRGLTGHCMAYAQLGMSTAERLPPPYAGRSTAGAIQVDEDDDAADATRAGGTPYDEVDEASDESFPASDPPSFTPDSHMGTTH